MRTDLRSPCYFMTWTEAPGPGTEDGKPVGQKSELRAWRYRDKKGAVFLALIGDPVSPATTQRWGRSFPGSRCGESIQGVVVRKEGVEIGQKNGGGRVYCVETGMEEKNFWLLAHPVPGGRP
jgi:hypothetical protein